MSIVPFYMRILDNLTPASLFDQDFGMGLLDDDLFMSPRSHHWYLRPWSQRSSAVSNLVNTKEEFKVNLDVQQFKPEEINVKVVDNFVVIEGKHEERQDEHGFITREFTRRYMLPDDVDPATVNSCLSSDGVLCVQAPKKPKEAAVTNERPIPIKFSNKPAIKASAKKNEPKGGENMEQ